MSYKQSIRRSLRTGIIVMMALVVSIVAPAQVLAAAGSTNNRQQLFRSVAQEFGVPSDVLMAISYNQSRWENHEGKPSVGGGYGLMHLTAPTLIDEDARGDASRPLAPRTQAARGENTLATAASLIGQNAETVKTNDAQNIRAAAALLAKYAKEANGGKVPASAGDFYDAVVRVSGITDATQALEFADSVYSTMQKGAALTTTDGQNLQLPAQNVQPNKGRTSTLAVPDVLKKQPSNPNATETECPRAITCKFVPARYAQNNPTNPADYGNMDVTNRPKDTKINYIVIHDTEGSYQSAIDWFQDPTSYVAGHYVIRSSDGEVTQMIKNKDIGWHAGNWYMNMHSIGVEHEGYAADGSWYTETMYRTSAKLVRYLAGKYDIPLDRQHIVGHDQFHGLTPARAQKMHHDPGPFWDWDYYMELLQGRDGTRSEVLKTNDTNETTVTAEIQSKLQAKQSAQAVTTQEKHNGLYGSKVVTITPRFATNQPPLQKCDPVTKVCVDLPKQGANFVYLRTEPRNDAPLITDVGMHPDGEPGTTRVDDWSAKATNGQNFVVAERRGDWTAIWFSGQKGWFYNPTSWRDRTATPSWSQRVTPKQGKTTIPVYGRPVPEATAYKNGVPVLPEAMLQYKILAGQSYPAYQRSAANDYLYVSTFDRSNPGDGTVTVGNEKYIPIEYNHRQAFVKASDVDLAWY